MVRGRLGYLCVGAGSANQGDARLRANGTAQHLRPSEGCRWSKEGVCNETGWIRCLEGLSHCQMDSAVVNKHGTRTFSQKLGRLAKAALGHGSQVLILSTPR